MKWNEEKAKYRQVIYSTIYWIIINNKQIFQTNLAVCSINTINKYHLQRPMVNLSWEENCGLLGCQAACSSNNPEESSSHLLHGGNLKSCQTFMLLEKYYTDIKIFNSLPFSLIHVMNKKARFKAALIRYLIAHSLYYSDKFP
jgi:hypothetical protein